MVGLDPSGEAVGNGMALAMIDLTWSVSGTYTDAKASVRGSTLTGNTW